jgi:outer membrane protein assembly factor BamE (lipoprotein component of BamABCDE complex)
MTEKVLFLAVTTMLVVFCGCATTAPVWKASALESLEIGKSTRADSEKLFGAPRVTESRSDANGTFEYLYYKTQAERGGMGRVRLLTLEFKDKVLNGYLFGSSFDGDRTGFTTANIPKVVPAGSTKEQVQELLGKPAGRFRCPTGITDMRVKCGLIEREIWLYLDLEGVPLLTPGRERSGWFGSNCEISFDEYGLVSDISTVNRQRPK